MHHDLPLNAWQISKRKICIVLACDRNSRNFPLVLSPLGLEDKAEGPLTLPAGARSQETEGRPRRTTHTPALNSQQMDIGTVWFSSYLPLPLSEILRAVPLQELSATPKNRRLPLPSHGPGAGKTCEEDSGFPQACSSLQDGGSTAGTPRSKSPLSASR